jgi:hypothetical protein
MEQNLPPTPAETLNSRKVAAAGSGNPGNPDLLINTEEISAEIAHFSRLSSDLTEFLSGLLRKIQGWMTA